MRSITGIGLIILIVMSVFGMAISGAMMGMMRMGSSANLLQEMSRMKDDVGKACIKPASISDAEAGATSSDIEFIEAPAYPNQFNCMTCPDLLWRGIVRSGLSLVTIAGFKGGGSKTPESFGSSDDLAKLGAEFADDFADAGTDFAKAAKAALDTGSDSVDDAAKAAATAAEKAGANADDIAEMTARFYDTASSYSPAIVKKTTETTVKKSLEDAVNQRNLELANAGKPLITVEAMSAQTIKTLGLNYAWYVKALRYIASPKLYVCAATGFISTFTHGAMPVATTVNVGIQKGWSSCGIGSVIGGLAGLGLHGYSLSQNYNYVQNDINRYTEYLKVINDQYDIVASVLSDYTAEIPIGMDQSLFVSKKLENYNSLTTIASQADRYSFDMNAKSKEIFDIMYGTLYNKFGDQAYADYYFSSSSDARMSNTLWSGIASQLDDSLIGTPAGDEPVVRLRPLHIGAIFANSQVWLDQKSESYKVTKKGIDDAYETFSKGHPYPTLEELTSFLESLDADTDGTSLLKDLEEQELKANPSKKTARDDILEIIYDLKKVQTLVSAIQEDEKQLEQIQDQAWPLLSDAKCDSDPFQLGDMTIVKSKCAIVQDCDWDHVLDYAFYEDQDIALGDCVNLAVIVNSPTTNDPLRGNVPWRTMPAFKMDKEKTAEMLNMLTRAQSAGLIRPIERIAGGIAIGSIGRMAGAWTDMAQYCTSNYSNAMACCIEVADCKVGLCRICDSISCARPITITPKLQPGIVVDTSSPTGVEISGNIGFLS